MSDAHEQDPRDGVDFEEWATPVGYDFGLDRRTFVQVLSTGWLLLVGSPALAQRSPERGGNRTPIAARIHLGRDGTFTVFTGKVEMGQGARAELTQAAAEELRVAPEHIRMVMADTDRVPDDGLTAGSRTTPSTVPAVRQGAAAAHRALMTWACERWTAEPGDVEVRAGKAHHRPTGRTLSYADLAAAEDAAERFRQEIPRDIPLVPVASWAVLGRPLPRPNRRDLVTGRHAYPSDFRLPGMVYGKVLRPPSYGATLSAIDPRPAERMEGVTVVRDDGFVGVTAPTTWQARTALEALAHTAVWTRADHPSSTEIYAYLRAQARGGVPANPFAEVVARAPRSLQQTYQVAYVQHAPLEPRAAVAAWEDGKLTVWTGTQNPFGYRRELMSALHLAEDKVRVIVPDFGGGFGGKHTGEAAVEAARLARGVGKPVSLVWTREEEFVWACFRPAAVMDLEASLDAEGRLTSWHHVNIHAGGAAIDTPYRTGQARSQFVPSANPLRNGSYRALAATANAFARECFMDELAAVAGQDPLAFRMAHLANDRLRAVLEKAAAAFGWAERVQRREPNVGVGLACATEKGSVVATCVEVERDPALPQYRVREVCEAFECGPILDRENLEAQVQGCIVMALGPALREGMRFAGGRILNASFRKYQVPRIADLPRLDLHYVERRDLAPAGAGETPLIAVAPAIANAVFHATGSRVREMPIRWPGTTEA